MVSLLGGEEEEREREGEGKGREGADETERGALVLVGCCGGLRGGENGCLGARAGKGGLEMFNLSRFSFAVDLGIRE